MCNLLIPLCPFVLHSITAADSAATQNAPSTSSSTDAKILFSYLSKRPYRSPGAPPNTQQPKPLALPSLKLYKRTTWHTCPCFFNYIAVLHPRPGPSRPTFGSAGKYCARCSSAARLLRPIRRGGPMDRNTRNDQYWNRCSFLGASTVFEADDGTEEVCQNRETRVPSQPEPARSGEQAQIFNDYYSPQQRREEVSIGDSPRHRRYGEESYSTSSKSRYQDDLDSYLGETYGGRRR